jgi:cobalt-zinc-cadmium efflux system outer membrane protein
MADAAWRAEGDLLPGDDPTDLDALRATAQTQPELLALTSRLEAATLEAEAARRWWLPDLRLEGGWKGVDQGVSGRTDGFILGATLAFPLHGTAPGLAHAADGEARALRGRRALRESALDGELGAARSEAVALRQAALTFRKEATAASADLVRIASAGYAGGELTLLELLDAFSGAAEDALTSLDLAHAARRARIALGRSTGAGQP